jgi:hypothetical protein
MKNLTNYTEFINESKLQEDYRNFFSNLLKLYGVKSPIEFKDDVEKSKKFYEDIEKGWSKGNGLTEYGKKLLKEEPIEEGVLNEEKIDL